MKAVFYSMRCLLGFSLLFFSCSKTTEQTNIYQTSNPTVLPSYCELIHDPLGVHESSACYPVLAVDKMGRRYNGKVLFKGDFGAGYINLSQVDSVFINVRCAIDVSYIALDLQGNKYQVFLKSEDI
ncbi:hypothetical protein [Myroides sp. LJL119]